METMRLALLKVGGVGMTLLMGCGPHYVPNETGNAWEASCTVNTECYAKLLLICTPKVEATMPDAIEGVAYLQSTSTLLECMRPGKRAQNTCCNGVRGGYALRLDDGTTLTLAHPDLSCTGDDSGMCCGTEIAEGTRLRVSGERRKHDVFEVSSLCEVM